VAAKAPAFFGEHVARYRRFVADGTFADPQRDRSMAVFTTRGAEEFAMEDPFVVNRVVVGWTIKEWNEVLMGEPA
jgi:uncharacterized protein